PRFRPHLHRAHGPDLLDRRPRLARRRADSLRAAHARPWHIGPPLRPGRIRGTEGVPPGRRRRRRLSARQARGALSQLRTTARATRAPRGGLPAQAQASAQGCDQVVWLDSRDHRWIEEMGGMNLCFVYGRGNQARLMTPALTGTLLPGVTRDSLLTIGSDLGYATEEGRISVDEWRHGCEDGSLTEVFACGTAAVITPVAAVKSARGAWTVGDGGAGEVSMRLRRALVDIQRGAALDPH